MTDAFLDSGRSFEHWFSQLPGATFHPDIQVVDYRSRNAGRGIAATRDIPEDTVLFTIPRHAILHAENPQLSPDLVRILNEPDASSNAATNDSDDDSDTSLDSWAKLILILIHEHLRGPASPWKPYLDILPRTFDTPMFWSPQELAELQHSPLVAKIGRAGAEAIFRHKIISRIRAHPAVFFPAATPPLSDPELVALAHQMGSTIMAYAFDLDNEPEDDDEDEQDGWVEDRDGQGLLGMVPMADVLNANAEFNAHVNHGEDALSVTSLRPIQAGEEILNYYGPHPNSELLRRYGYVTAEHARHDVAEIPWSTVETALQQSLGFSDGDARWPALLSQIDPDDLDDSFVVERAVEDVGADGRFAQPPAPPTVPPELAHLLKSILRAAEKAHPELIPSKRKRQDLYRSVVRQAVHSVLQGYANPACDRELLLRTDLGPRHRMAVQVRLGEATVLHELLQDPALQPEQDDGHGVNGDGPSAKRQRH